MTTMFKFWTVFVLIILVVNADVSNKKAPFTFRPYTGCCDIPALGETKPECNDIKPIDTENICRRVQCAFEDFGFLTEKNTVIKDKYKSYLQEWANKNKDWAAGVNMTMANCIDKDLTPSINVVCNAYDMYSCTAIYMIANCPKDAWKCDE